jgi:predicted MFS family arabinose efflux permease
VTAKTWREGRDGMSNYTEEEQKLLEPAYRARFLFVMFLVCMFDFADRSIFTVTAQTIKQELTLNDFEIGILGGFMFAALYSFVGIPIGRLAERKSRVRIVAVCTAIWSAATVWCGLAQNFVTLALGRVGVGFGEAGFMGPANSLNSDHHKAEKRASRMSLILMGTPVGTFVGASLGGWAAQVHDWRLGFYILGAGGLVTAVLVVLLLKEPQRGLVDNLPKSPAPPPSFGKFLKLVVTKKALLFVIIGGALASIGMTSISNFMAIFLARVHELPPRDAGSLFGTISAIALAIGLLTGSWGSDFLAKFDRRWWAWAPAIGLACAPLVYFAAFSAESLTAATILLVASGATLLLFYGPTVAMIQNLVEPKMRATGAAVYSMLYAMIGYGFGPPFVGFLSDRITESSFAGGGFEQACPGGIAPASSAEALVSACAAASATGIQRALMLAVCVLFFSSVAFVFASRTLRADFYRPEGAVGPGAAPAAKPAE